MNELGEPVTVVPMTTPFSTLKGAVPLSCSHPLRSFFTSFFHCPSAEDTETNNNNIAVNIQVNFFIINVFSTSYLIIFYFIFFMSHSSCHLITGMSFSHSTGSQMCLLSARFCGFHLSPMYTKTFFFILTGRTKVL